MGSRGRSIRLRIYFLVAIPLVAMVGLLAYVAGTSVNNAINLDRAPNLINATSLPTAEFVKMVQNERAAAVVYLFQPTPANLAAYDTAVKATDTDQPKFLAAMNSPGTKSSETAGEAKAISVLIAGLNQMQTLRAAVTNRAVSPLQALGAYTAGIQDELKLFLAEADSLTNATASAQALGLIATVSAREALSEEYALLSGVLAGNRITQADRAAFAEMAAVRQGDMVDAESLLDPAGQALFNAQVNNAEQTQLTEIEGAVSAGIPVATLRITPDQWTGLAGHLLDEYFTGGVNVANAQLAADHTISRAAWTRVAVTGAIGLVGLLVTIAVTILVGRGIIRRLGDLERNALQLAEVQLPDVVARLRRGENVDVNAEAPALRVGGDEIGRVGQAFDLVRQTAVRAAVEEARLRQGLNDVFRSLARRSQSLLHRQLTLLDQMERRASDPEALDDLFRLDHLTTRMRRHAEGLVILAGAPPGRGWSSPVRMVDVMRGAIAEVEDYARVSVATRSQAALAGSAVADVIHLLAELIENATTLSPPYTSVRVSGDTVANGFAIEVEDRGLGMSPARLAELNDLLPKDGVSGGNCEIAEQNSESQSAVVTPSPPCRHDRPHQRPESPSAEQDAHAKHGSARWVDARPVDGKLASSHHGEDHPARADHQLPCLAKTVGDHVAMAANVRIPSSTGVKSTRSRARNGAAASACGSANCILRIRTADVRNDSALSTNTASRPKNAATTPPTEAPIIRLTDHVADDSVLAMCRRLVGIAG